ncbi:two-component regulator propeller domain-containing protein [Pseudoduganella aquatica]|uniref:two-component regulator propeller domain-containing protein n=1 Tax=Pseudoduganella aquatica TaxID=2660641 RepID=UPI001E2DB627|nr:two-component regulator propeller domain-containing protein [Pseudoduganella aquatica]
MARPARLLLASLLLAAGLANPAHAAPAPVRQLRFENLSALHFTMPASSVLALAQDGQGLIWMGTQSGLFRHDGQRSTIYRNDAANPLSLPGNYVSAIFRDSRQRMWFGTNNGLARFDAERGAFVSHRPAAGPSLFVRSIISDGKDGLWLGTAAGLHHFDTASGRFTAYAHDPQRPGTPASDRVEALARDPEGGLWLSVWPHGIDYLPPGGSAFQHFQPDDSAAPNAKLNTVSALLLDGQRQLWIGTAGGVLRWNIGSPWAQRERLPAPPEVGDFSVYTIYQDRSDAVWIGTQPAGLLRWDAAQQQFSSYQHRLGDPNSLPSNRIPSVLVDHSNTLWAGTWDNGVARVDLGSQGLGRFLPAAGTQDSAPRGNVVGSLSHADEGRLWLGGPSGVRLYDPASGSVLRSYRHDPAQPGSLPNDFVMALLQPPGGPLWAGTSTGLSRLDPAGGTFREYRFGAQDRNFVRGIARASGGALWLGTDGGVLRFDPASGKAEALPAGRALSAIHNAGALLEDSKGRLWIGSPYGRGLDLRGADGALRSYRSDGKPGSLSNDFVNCVYEDRQGRVWIGTRSGLNLVSQQADGSLRFSASRRDGLSGMEITAIESDAEGQLWLTVTGALLRFDPASGAVASHYASDGISSGNFINGASLAGADGTLYFGAFQGLTIVHPDAMRGNTIAPQLTVTGLSVMNRSLALLPRPEAVGLEGTLSAPSRLRLPWDMATFSLEFTATHFADPERNRYAYRLDGLDRDWIAADAAHRVATYTSLRPGSYTLRVKAVTKNGVWSDQELVLPVTVTPPFWATWWFRALAALAAVLGLRWLYRWRVRSLRQHQLLLEGQVAQRTSELAGKNEALSKAYAALQNLSVTDPLTGLRNRRYIEQKLPPEVQLILRRHEASAAPAPRSAALIFFLVDLDHFKQVNDRYGHPAGDHVLMAMRERLARVFRDSDFLVRWGGEEFLVVARDIDPAGAGALAARLCEAVAGQPFVLEDGSCIRQTCSVGYASFPFLPSRPRLLSWQQTIKLADLGLYAAKRSGRAAWVGLGCGPAAPAPEQVQQMLQQPGGALAAGHLAATASIADDALAMAWSTLDHTA